MDSSKALIPQSFKIFYLSVFSLKTRRIVLFCVYYFITNSVCFLLLSAESHEKPTSLSKSLQQPRHLHQTALRSAHKSISRRPRIPIPPTAVANQPSVVGPTIARSQGSNNVECSNRSGGAGG